MTITNRSKDRQYNGRKKNDRRTLHWKPQT